MSYKLIYQTETKLIVNTQCIFLIFKRHFKLHFFGIVTGLLFSFYQVQHIPLIYESKIVLSTGHYPGYFYAVSNVEHEKFTRLFAFNERGERLNINEVKLVLRSVEIAEIAMTDFDIHKKIFYREWDEKTEAFEAKPVSSVKFFLNKLKLIILAQDEREYLAPNPARVQAVFNKMIKIKLDTTRKTLTLTCSGPMSLHCDAVLLAVVGSANKFYFNRQQKLILGQGCDTKAIITKQHFSSDHHCALLQLSQSLNFLLLEKNENFALTQIQTRMMEPLYNLDRELQIYFRNYILFSIVLASIHWGYIRFSVNNAYKKE